ncbi:uncharacterized protein METZ01_LOCUS42996 [marine metagenome]|uniref:Amidase domain-containing protein n=1 Tax=marine metagenome TaxID=408172 RepID=A0A381REC3_9ZZZZ
MEPWGPQVELADLPAVEQLDLLSTRQLSCRELLTACQERAEITEPVVNAIPTSDWEAAALVAQRLDDDPSTLAGAPLRGLVIAHKDLLETADFRTTYGSPIFADFTPEEDHPLVVALRQAGLVAIGKTNTPEFGAGSHTYNPLHGPTRNPWDPTRSAGGSSGGAAAALACGALSVADGSDLGGSLRNPASFCGVVGFRPTAGTVPYRVEHDDRIRMSTSGPMGRTVDDVTLLHSVMAPAVSEGPPVPRAPRLAVSADLGDLPLDPAVRTVVEQAVIKLELDGWAVEAGLPDLDHADRCFEDLRALGFAARFDFRPADPRVKDVVRAEVAAGNSLDETRILAAVAIETRLQTTWDAFFTNYDVFACATSQVPPFPLDQPWVRQIDDVPMDRYTDWMRSCSRLSVPAGPSISIPVGFTKDGLPVGMQLCAARYHDKMLLGLARLAEQTLCVERRPPLERIAALDPAALPSGPPPENR